MLTNNLEYFGRVLMDAFEETGLIKDKELQNLKKKSSLHMNSSFKLCPEEIGKKFSKNLIQGVYLILLLIAEVSSNISER